MEPRIQFGRKWVKVNDSVFYLPEYEIDAIKRWYRFQQLIGEPRKSEKQMATETEYLVKAFLLMKPKDDAETSFDLILLDNLYEQSNGDVRIIINKIYEHR